MKIVQGIDYAVPNGDYSIFPEKVPTISKWMEIFLLFLPSVIIETDESILRVKTWMGKYYIVESKLKNEPDNP